MARSLAPGTLGKYEAAWQDFDAWCYAARMGDAIDATPLVVGEYVAHLVACRLAWSTIEGRIAAINFAFGLTGKPSPATAIGVRRALEGAKRTVGTTQRRAAALTIGPMRKIVMGLPIVRARQPSMRRDQLLIALGWSAALRSSELVGLDVSDLQFHGDPSTPGSGGMLVWLGRSKTDQSAKGQWVAVPWATLTSSCPARLALTYTRRIKEGPLFRAIDRHGNPKRRLSSEAVTDVVRGLVAGMLQEDPAPYSSHSLRAGFQTSAEDARVDADLIARHMRHAQRFQEMRRVYDRPVSLFDRSPFDSDWW